MKIIRASVLMAAICVVVAPHPVKAQMAIAAAMTGEAQVKDDLFAGVEKFAQGASEVSDVNLDKSMLGLVGKSSDGRANKLEFIVVHSYSYDKPGMYKMEDVEVFRKRLTDGSWSCSIHTKDKDKRNGVQLARKMDFVIVRSYEYDKKGQYNMADVEEFRKRLEEGGWSHVVKERSATDSTDVCVKTDKDGQFSELVVIAAEPTELTFVHLKGHMSMDDLTRMGSHYGVPQDGVNAGLQKRQK
jgi:hypothetical protein